MEWRFGAAAVPAACFTWGLVEARLYRLRSHRLRVLPPGAASVRILQVSDLHLRLANGRLARFLDYLGDARYDVVLATGDLLGERAAVERCARLLNGLRGDVGRYFVLGSADYYAPKFKNYLDYFLRRQSHGTKRNRTREFKDLLLAGGWTDLTNRTLAVELGGTACQVTGLDDPYLRRDDRSLLVRDAGAAFALCVVHDPAPYLDAARAGFDLIVAGHTHGGQVRLPLFGAVVTNSRLPRQLARGPSLVDGALLFVNPGLGTGRYAPFRFLCPPEASVLELLPRAAQPPPATRSKTSS